MAQGQEDDRINQENERKRELERSEAAKIAKMESFIKSPACDQETKRLITQKLNKYYIELAMDSTPLPAVSTVQTHARQCVTSPTSSDDEKSPEVHSYESYFAESPPGPSPSLKFIFGGYSSSDSSSVSTC